MKLLVLVTSLLVLALPSWAQFNSPHPPMRAAVLNCTYDMESASGTQVLGSGTGGCAANALFNFAPTYCSGFGSVNSNAPGTYQTFAGHVDSSLAQGVLTGSVGVVNTGNDRFFIVQSLVGADAQLGAVTALGVGSVTITWTKVGTPTGSFLQSVACFK